MTTVYKKAVWIAARYNSQFGFDIIRLERDGRMAESQRVSFFDLCSFEWSANGRDTFSVAH